MLFSEELASKKSQGKMNVTSKAQEHRGEGLLQASGHRNERLDPEREAKFRFGD